jgi:wyosine [tRNA(Phe)-imidazoG37] synthetase (radical SAM superfamily)
MPATYKLCSFDCVYCQYGRTLVHTLYPKQSELPTVVEVLTAVEKALAKPRTIESITFSGNGEPTLHPDFYEIVKGIKDLKDRLRPSAKLALLSNASRVNDPFLSEALGMIDMPMFKLDAGDEKTFYRINRPVDGINYFDILQGLKKVRSLVIQSGLISGAISNIHGQTYENWATALREINPQQVHIYSAERPTAFPEIKCVSPQRLLQIKDDLQTRFKLVVEAFWQS